jgi:hypothetical protein
MKDNIMVCNIFLLATLQSVVEFRVFEVYLLMNLEAFHVRRTEYLGLNDFNEPR